jgi:hypothetical protein
MCICVQIPRDSFRKGSVLSALGPNMVPLNVEKSSSSLPLLLHSARDTLMELPTLGSYMCVSVCV